MGTAWMALHPPGCDGWMALSMCFHGSLLLEWEGPEKDGSCVYQQKQNVISIGKYFKVLQPFKMKQNRSLQNVHSSHCSSWACLFQGKQISLAVAHADSSSSSALPCPHSEFGEAFVIQNLLTVLIPASPNRRFPALFVGRTLQFSILPWAPPAFSSWNDARDAARAASTRGWPSLHLNPGV